MEQTHSEHKEYIVIGGGPAGIQLGYYFEKYGENYLILEKDGEAGAFFKKFPRHRQLISINKVYTGFEEPEINMRWDWNSLISDENGLMFKEFDQDYFPSADNMVLYLNAFRKKYNINVSFNSEVLKIKRGDNQFELKMSDGRLYTCNKIIVATGYGESKTPDFPGVEMATDYADMSVDLDEYRNKRVMIVGKGNSAFETANHLSEVTPCIHMVSPNSVKLAWKNHYVGSLRAVNNNFLDTYQLKSQNTVIDGEIERVLKSENKLIVRINLSHAKGSKIDIPVDKLLICAGFKIDTSIFDPSCFPKLKHMDKFPALTNEWESENIKGMYFAGALMHSVDYKKTFSGFIHGFRYNVELLYKNLKNKYDNVEYANEKLGLDAKHVYTYLLDRIHSLSSLFQQPGFLCDVITIDKKSGHRYYKDIYYKLIDEDKVIPRNIPHLRLSMEYGSKVHADPFNVDREPEKGSESDFIHPVIRYYENGMLVDTYHIPEDIENDWYQEFYVVPLLKYLNDKFESDIDFASLMAKPQLSGYKNVAQVV